MPGRLDTVPSAHSRSLASVRFLPQTRTPLRVGAKCGRPHRGSNRALTTGTSVGFRRRIDRWTPVTGVWERVRKRGVPRLFQEFQQSAGDYSKEVRMHIFLIGEVETSQYGCALWRLIGSDDCWSFIAKCSGKVDNIRENVWATLALSILHWIAETSLSYATSIREMPQWYTPSSVHKMTVQCEPHPIPPRQRVNAPHLSDWGGRSVLNPVNLTTRRKGVAPWVARDALFVPIPWLYGTIICYVVK